MVLILYLFFLQVQDTSYDIEANVVVADFIYFVTLTGFGDVFDYRRYQISFE